MSNLSLKEMLLEIDTCLGRNDLKQVDFAVLYALRYLIIQSDIEASGEGIINSSGNIYIENGRKYIGKKVRWIIPKDGGVGLY